MIFKNNKSEKTVVSVRLDTDLLERIDFIAEQNELSRNEVISQGMKFALDTEDANNKAKEKAKNKKKATKEKETPPPDNSNSDED